MIEETKKRRSLVLTVISVAILAIAVGYMIYSMVVVREITWTFRIVMGGGIFLFWLIEDVIKPVMLEAFEGKTPEQKKAYYVYAALSLAGYAGLVYYALCMDRQTGIYGVLVYAGTMFAKRRIYDDFRGISRDEEDDDDDSEITQEADFREIAGEAEEADFREVADEAEEADFREVADEAEEADFREVTGEAEEADFREVADEAEEADFRETADKADFREISEKAGTAAGE